jgi:SAM-dependent methyltransferase
VQGIVPLDYVEKMVEDPKRAASFTRMLYEHHLGLADELAWRLDLAGARLLLDVGGGSGVVSLALLERYPELAAVVVDIENVCAVGREIAAERGLGDRIAYHAADFLSDAFPGEFAGQFDVVMYCDAGPDTEEIFRKLQDALRAGGRLVAVVRPTEAGKIPPIPLLHWMLLGALEEPDHERITTEVVRERLRQVEFEILSESTFTDDIAEDWTVIVARRA